MAGVLGQFSPSARGVHRLTLGADSLDWTRVGNADCTDLRCYQNGAEIDCWVAPGASKAGTAATLYARTVDADAPVTIRTAGAGASAYAGTTRLPAGLPAGAAKLALSVNNSAAGVLNPITSLLHPSAVYVPGGFGGHEYWMAVTPFDVSGDDYEDPHVLYSDDGATWAEADVNATGFSNLDHVSNTATEFHSDPCLVYDPDAGKLYCYYRYSATGVERIYRQESGDGVTWGSKTQVLSVGTGSTISPAVVRRAAGDWHMLVTTQTGLTMGVARYASADGLTWASAGAVAPFWPDGDYHGPWHIDLHYVDSIGRYVALFPMARKGVSAPGLGGQLFLAFSDDLETWELDPLAVMGPGAEAGAAWANEAIYKSCLLPTTAGNYRLFWSARNASNGTWGCATITFAADWAERGLSGLTATTLAGDDFEDGNYAHSPSWTKVSGNASVASGILTLTRDAGAAGVLLTGDVPGNDWTFEARFQLVNASSRFGFGYYSAPEGFRWNYSAGAVDATTGGSAASALAVDTAWHVARVRRSGNDYTVYVDGAQVHAETSATNRQDQGKVILHASGSAANDGVRVDHVFWHYGAGATATVEAVVPSSVTAAASQSFGFGFGY